MASQVGETDSDKVLRIYCRDYGENVLGVGKKSREQSV